MSDLVKQPEYFPPERAKQYQEKGYWTEDTFAEFFATCAGTFPDNEALVAKDCQGAARRATYRQLNQQITATADFLAGQGINPEDFVVVQLPNIYEYVLVIGALFRLGARPVFSLPAHRREELGHFIAQTKAKALICADKYQGFNHRELAESLREDTPELAVIIARADAGDNVCLSPAVWEGADSSSVRALDAVNPVSTDLAFLQVSGGTTGIPKLIPRTHADYLYSVRESAKICWLSPATRFLVVLPVSHNFTMSSPGILGVFWAGGCVVMTADPSPSTAFGLIAAEEITMTALVPPLALAWLSLAPVLKPNLESLEVLQVGGAKFTPEAARRVAPELGCTLQQVFGMAEGLVNYTRLDDPAELIETTQGKPISPDDEIRVVDDNGEDVVPGQRGHLLTRGPYTITGYFQGADPGSFTAGGFYSTGDIVRQLPSGHLVVEGRSKDQINRGGEKISAEEIEDHLISHPDILDAAVVAVADDSQGEKVFAFIVRTEGSTGKDLDAVAVRSYLRERGLAEYKLPDFFEFAASFPHTGVGKTSRKELRAMVQQYATQNNN
ncbi:enterobactin synthase subunit E [Corynebacterium phocae]|uniref:Long-chain-fatty-acid--CoA ligase n=1 Tax=Corynebacterium phocae TaxID=161895 RepID=A0A1L7D5Y9_9CORY|nr:AMP-binding protein [Corynebacterium phocae]APT93352.1 enterobactin synthase subunit E [Corynebacterium phocae]KAA8721689.1 AMP-binding protein [Corynebacterium phocae]